MRYSLVKFRTPVKHPGKPGDSLSGHDVYESPEFEMGDAGAWIRVRYVESGKARLFAMSQALLADEIEQQQAQPSAQQQHQGKRR